jgi:hypothetical protein
MKQFICSLPQSFLHPNPISFSGGDDARNFEPKTWLKFKDLDKSIQKLRKIYRDKPEWFEVLKPKSNKGRNVIDYSV